MKKLILAAVLLASAAQISNARSRDEDPGVGGPQVRYHSWCEKNVVMQDVQGRGVPRFNCSATGQVCKLGQKPLGPYLVVFAACANPNQR